MCATFPELFIGVTIYEIRQRCSAERSTTNRHTTNVADGMPIHPGLADVSVGVEINVDGTRKLQ
jgi:hypothetical protein